MLTQISVFLENKEGKLAKILSILENANINIRALSLADSADFGLVRLITHNAVETKAALDSAGCMTTLTDVVGVSVPDRVGGLSGLLNVLTEKGIAIEYMYSYVSGRGEDARMVLRVADAAATEALLKEKGYDIM